MPIRFQVDADFYDHPKAIGMSDAATALWVRAGSYSAAKLTDGFVAEHVLSLLSRCPEEASGELVTRGLWRRVRGGFVFHSWEERNLTRERVEDYRARDRERKREDRRDASVTHPVTCKQCGHAFVTARSDAKYCSPRCRKRASRETEPQAETEVVHPGIHTGLRAESERNPSAVVSVSVSESVLGSGHASVTTQEPPARCPQHLNDERPPPCGQCAEARKANERWQAERRRRVDEAPRCRKHRGQLAATCAQCRSELVGDRDAPGWNAPTTAVRAVVPMPHTGPT